MKNFWQILKGLGVALLVVPILAVALFIGYVWMHQEAKPKEDPSCFTSEKILVKMSEHVFAIPRKYKPYMEKSTIKKDSNNKRTICYKDGDLPIEVGFISISIAALIPGYQFGDKRNSNGSFFAPQMDIRYLPRPINRDVFIRKNTKMYNCKKEDDSDNCSGMFTLHEAIMVSVWQVDNEFVPLENRQNFYKAVRTFVEGLEVRNNK